MAETSNLGKDKTVQIQKAEQIEKNDQLREMKAKTYHN